MGRNIIADWGLGIAESKKFGVKSSEFGAMSSNREINAGVIFLIRIIGSEYGVA